MTPPNNPKLWQIDALGLGVCAVLGLLWYFAGLQPLSQAKAARLTMADDVAAREQRADRAEKALGVAHRNLGDVNARVAAAKLVLKPVADMTERIGNISGLATQTHHLSVDEIKPGAPVPGPRFTTVPITVMGSGAAPECSAFLHDLRTKFPDVGVTAFDIRGEPTSPERGAKFTFNFVWYAAATPGAPTK